VKTVIAAIVALGTIGASAPAFADKCKAPKVKIVNKRTKEAAVKVAKIEYWDGCEGKYRTEELANAEIEKGGKSHTWTDDLEYVEGCEIKKFKVYRALRNTTGSAYGDYAWGGELVPNEGDNKKCVTGALYTIELHD
jgi:hypothetical protein